MGTELGLLQVTKNPFQLWPRLSTNALKSRTAQRRPEDSVAILGAGTSQGPRAPILV